MPGRREYICKGQEAYVRNQKVSHDFAKPQPFRYPVQ